MLLAPEHPLVEPFAGRVADPQAFRARGAALPRPRTAPRACRGEVEKEGFFTGRFAVNPFTSEPVPVWVANFVLGEYGTGAVMAVPAHDQRDFEFARKYGLPIRVVVVPADGEHDRRPTSLDRGRVTNDGVHRRLRRACDGLTSRGGAAAG